MSTPSSPQHPLPRVSQPVPQLPLFRPSSPPPRPEPPGPHRPAGGPPQQAPQQAFPPLPDRTIEANSYAIAYRLLGNRPAAAAVAGIAAERLRQTGQGSEPDWLCHLALYTLDQTVDPGVLGVPSPDGDPYAGLRTALRRRLARATHAERVAGALVHLAGYPPGFVGQLMGCPETRAVELARVLAPPPGVAYRELGDPQLTRTAAPPDPAAAGLRRRRPHWTTIALAAMVLAAVVVATQISGPRPTLGPPVDEGGAPLTQELQRNGGPLTQLTNE